MKDSKQVRSEHQTFIDAWKTINENTYSTLATTEDAKWGYDKDGNSLNPKDKKKKQKVEMVLVRKDNAFTEQAEKYQMVVKQFARFVEANNHLFDIPTRKKAILANKFQGFKEDAEWDEFFGDQELIDENLLKKADTALGKYKVAAGNTVRKVVKSTAQNVGKVGAEVVKGYKSGMSSEAYVVHTADKKANTPAWQGYLEGKINEVTGEPLYVAGEDLQQEGVGAALLGGALATGMAVKGIQTAKKVHSNLKSGKGSIGGARQKTSDAIKQLTQETQVEGEDLQEITTKDTKSGTKFKIRVKDKATGSSYIRFATREKIAQLRADPKIASVEMTDEGQTPEERGEKKAQAAGGGDSPKDKHKAEHPKAASSEKTTVKKRSVTTESRSDWRSDLKEVIGDEIVENKGKKKGKKTKNEVCINPDTDDEKNKYEGVDALKIAESLGAELKGLEVEDANGKVAYEVVDLITPEPMKGMASEDLQQTVGKVLDRGTKFVKQNPVGKVLGAVVSPVKGNTGKNYPTKATQDAKGLRTGN